MEIEILEVYNSGTSSENERVKLKVLVDDLDLSDFALVDKTFDSNGEVSNIHPHFYRLPKVIANKNDTVIIQTGVKPAGYNFFRKIQEPQTYKFWCGSNNSFWNDTGDTAKLYKLKIEDIKTVPAIEKKHD